MLLTARGGTQETRCGLEAMEALLVAGALQGAQPRAATLLQVYSLFVQVNPSAKQIEFRTKVGGRFVKAAVQRVMECTATCHDNGESPPLTALHEDPAHLWHGPFRMSEETMKKLKKL